MPENQSQSKTCVVIGASHAGVNFAFSLRNEGWLGKIILIDADPALPYHRPPLSKAYLTTDDGIEKNLLKSKESYISADIMLLLSTKVMHINRKEKEVLLDNDKKLKYDKLVLATGARPFIPPIKGINEAEHVYPLRKAEDANTIKNVLNNSDAKRVVIIGGGYIGLETAASLKKMGASVVVLERENRVLARVTAPEMSSYFETLHQQNGVSIFTSKDVVSIVQKDAFSEVICSDDSKYQADIIIVGVGIRVNSEIAAEAGIKVSNGIHVDETTCSNDPNIYAIGDCTWHFNKHYQRQMRLECVQNALNQAKVAAANICGKHTIHDSVPWFWSDQYNVKLQMVGLSEGYTHIVMRTEPDKENCLSVWYFKNEELLAVDAVNNAKAYVYGTKLIKDRAKIDTKKLANPQEEFKIPNLILK